jgi:hypothetical protein
MWRGRIDAWAALLALALALGLGLASTAAAAAPAGTEPTRTVVSKVVKNKGHLIFKGRVEPEHVDKPVWIQRKKCGSCAWAFYAKVMSDETSHYKREVKPPRTGAWFYRAKVGAYGGYATSYSGVWKVYLA